MAKRRFVQLLPDIHNTETLKKFFGATVDQVFQPGNSEQLSGYIGSKPAYYDPVKDFYIGEPDATRAAYQLEPMMASYSGQGDVTNLLSYNDLIDYLKIESALTADQNRLFGDTYYGWAPPVDLDKLQNYRQYFWFGDKPHLMPALVLRARRYEYQGDGATYTFALPPTITVTTETESFQPTDHPLAFVNGLPVDFQRQGDILSLVQIPPPGTTVTLYRYGDLTAALNGRASFNPTEFVRPTWTPNSRWFEGDVAVVDGELYTCLADHTAGATFVASPNWTVATTDVICPSSLTSGMRLRLDDGVVFFQAYDRLPYEGFPLISTTVNDVDWEALPLESRPYEIFETSAPISSHVNLCHTSFEVPWDHTDRPTDFFVEGVGSTIQMVEYPDAMTFKDHSQNYVVIDRRSTDRNPWTVNNYWVHESAYRWAGVTFPTRRATRPIVEFIPNLELFAYGSTRLTDIDGTLTGDPYYLPRLLDRGTDYTKEVSDWDVLPFDSGRAEASAFKQIPLLEANGLPAAQLFADDRKPIVYGDRILILKSDIPDLNNAILKAVLGKTTQTVTYPDGTTQDTVVPCTIMLPEIAARPGNVVRLSKGRNVPWDAPAGSEAWFQAHPGLDNAVPYEFLNEAVEYYFDGSSASWLEAQAPHTGTPDPRFQIYTIDGQRHDGLAGSNFIGNRLFGFETRLSTDADATYDTILKRYVKRDDTGQIRFSNDQILSRTLLNGLTVVPGFQLYHVYDNGVTGERYSNSWFPTSERSHQILTNGSFEIPKNLLSNPQNDEVGLISRNQYIENFTNILLRQPITGSPYNVNSWRDTPRDFGRSFGAERAWAAFSFFAAGERVSYLGGVYTCTGNHTSSTLFNRAYWTARPTHTILQNRTPMLRTMLLASDRRFDYLDAVRFVDNEYARFRRKFRQYVSQMHQNGTLRVSDDPDLWVETALKFLKQAKTNDFPFALSEMAGGQYFIPPTGAQMGLLNCYVPGYELDDTYSPDALFLRGHDGSRTPINGALDGLGNPLNVAFEDTILLALERRIYANILSEFKTDADRPFDFYALTDGKWRGTGDGTESTTGDPNPCDDTPPPVETGRTSYSPGEIVQLYTPIFLRYAQLNGLDWRTNRTYVQTDPFTWNYHGVPDRDGTKMPGSFRAIYRYYFDTDRPHAEPWAMLGFGQKPSWWDREYGVAPYTLGNTKMWTDLSQGRVRQGSRAGIDPRFVRPGLFQYLPVNDEGVLLDPMAAGIFPVAPTPAQAAANWLVGDLGPGETLWMNSVDYPYAKCQFGYLMRPAEWVELNWDSENFAVYSDGQVYNRLSKDRPKAATHLVHGVTYADTTASVVPRLSFGRVVLLGIQQWISDLMTSRNQKPLDLYTALSGLRVQLSHKMAGFTRADSLRVFADNSGIMPEQDVTVILHQSPPYREAVYSGVIVEWTGDGYSVVGYDTVKNGFCIEEGDENSQTRTISLGEEPPVYEWHANVYYEVGMLVDYRGTTYRCVVAHTASLKFDDEFWSAQQRVNNAFPKVTVYEGTTGTVRFIPYGTTFKTRQDVARFLWDYGRALEAAGFVFDYIDPSTGEIVDWELMIRKFLVWSQMDWQPGNFIALSPGASQLKFISTHGVVYNLEEVANGLYGLLDRTGRPISHTQTFVSRLDEETKIITLTNNLFCARLRVGEIEHVVLFSNQTIFGDVIYEPLLSLRQPRLRMFGMRTNQWSGRLDAPGYMVEDDTTQPNFWRAAENIRRMFDVEFAEDPTLRDYARHVIGYQKRPYLDNLLISETEQFEFYQGSIKQKGAPGAFQKLTRSRIVDQNSDLSFLEEWAFKTGYFGSTENFSRYAFQMQRTDMRGNPQLVQFTDGSLLNETVLGVGPTSARWVTPPADMSGLSTLIPYFKETLSQGLGSAVTDPKARWLRTGGPVRVPEITYTIANPQLLTPLFRTLVGEGRAFAENDRIWIYNTAETVAAWDVLRLNLIGGGTNPLIALETSGEDDFLSDHAIRLVFQGPHGLNRSDEGAWILIPRQIYNADYDFGGFHQIAQVDSPTSVLISFYTFASTFQGIDFTKTQMPSVFLLRSMRFADRIERDRFQQARGFKTGEYAYLDAHPDFFGWTVWQWSGVQWNLWRQQPAKIDSTKIRNTKIFGLNTSFDTSTASPTISPQPLHFSDIVVIDPVMGMICGEAERELSFRAAIDPAEYQRGTIYQNAWGPEHVGQLWWDTSKSIFLETETDVLTPENPARYEREMRYRAERWGRVAPGCGIDVWEWTRALTPPYTPGVNNAALFGDVNQFFEFDPILNKNVTAYYYWSRNVAVLPDNCPTRRKTAAQVADLIANPRVEDVTWVATIAPNAMLFSNVEEYLNDTDTVMQFDLIDDHYDGVVHHEYGLARKGDADSLPPAYLFSQMRNSLTGFDDFVQDVPDPTNAYEALGARVRPRQNMIAGGRTGVLAARQSFVTKLNEILARTPLLVDQPNALDELTQETPNYGQLVWNNPVGQNWIDAPPKGSYDLVAEGLDQRRELLSSNAILKLAGFRGFDQTPYSDSAWDFDFNTTIHDLDNRRNPRILMTNYTADTPSWSIWEVKLFNENGPVPDVSPIPKPKPPDRPLPADPVPPVAIDDIYTLSQGAVRVTIKGSEIMSNDFDPDGRSFHILNVGPLAQGYPGTLTMLSASTWQYEGPVGISGEIQIPYTIIDSRGLTATAIIRIRIPKPATIQAVDDFYTTREDTPLQIAVLDLLANDIGANISLRSLGTPALGGSVVLENGVITFTPAALPSTADSFTYTITNPEGDTSTSTVHVSLTAVPVVAQDDHFTFDVCEPVVTPFQAVDDEITVDGRHITNYSGYRSNTTVQGGTLLTSFGFAAGETITLISQPIVTVSAASTVQDLIDSFNGLFSAPGYLMMIYDGSAIGMAASTGNLAILRYGAPVSYGDITSIDARLWGPGDRALNFAAYQTGEGEAETAFPASVFLANDIGVDGTTRITSITPPSRINARLDVAGQTIYVQRPASFGGYGDINGDSFTYTIAKGSQTATANVNVTVFNLSGGL